MQAQTKIDTTAINQLINTDGKKNFGQLSVQRAKNAIRALLKTDYLEGYRAKALLFSHLNQYDEAIACIEEAKQYLAKNEVNFNLLMAEFDVKITSGAEWAVIKSLAIQLLTAIEQHPDNYSQEIKQYVFNTTILLSQIYLDDELIKILLEDSMDIVKEYQQKIILSKQCLENLQVDIAIYRRIISMMHNTLLNDYNVTFSLIAEPRQGYLSVNCYTNLSADEVSILNDKLIENIMTTFIDFAKIEQVMKINAMFVSGFQQTANDDELIQVA